MLDGYKPLQASCDHNMEGGGNYGPDYTMSFESDYS